MQDELGKVINTFDGREHCNIPDFAKKKLVQAILSAGYGKREALDEEAVMDILFKWSLQTLGGKNIEAIAKAIVARFGAREPLDKPAIEKIIYDTYFPCYNGQALSKKAAEKICD